MPVENLTEGSLPRVFWFLVAGVFINRVASFFYLLAYYLSQQHHFSEQTVGIAITIYGAGAIAAGPMGGWLADHLGRRTSMILSMLLSGCSMLQLSFAQAYWHVLLSTFMLGLLGDLFRPAMNAAIADLVVPLDRPRAYGWAYWANNLGFALSSLLAGYLVNISYSILFMVDAGTSIVFAGFLLLFVSETYGVKKSTQSRQEGTLIEPYKNWVFLTFLIVQFLLEFLLQQSIASLGLDMKNHGFSAQYFAYLNGVNAGFIAIMQPLLRRGIRYFRRSFVFAAGSLLIGLGLGLFSIVMKSFYLVILATVIWTLGEILMFSVVSPVIQDLSPPHSRGRYQGAYQLIVSLAALTAPLYGTFILSHYDSKSLWLSCISIGFGAACFHLLIAPARKRKLIQQYGETEACHLEEGHLWRSKNGSTK